MLAMARRAKEPPALATLHQEPLRATLAAAKKISVQMCKINCKSQSWNVPRDLPTIANQCQNPSVSTLTLSNLLICYLSDSNVSSLRCWCQTFSWHEMALRWHLGGSKKHIEKTPKTKNTRNAFQFEKLYKKLRHSNEKHVQNQFRGITQKIVGFRGLSVAMSWEVPGIPWDFSDVRGIPRDFLFQRSILEFPTALKNHAKVAADAGESDHPRSIRSLCKQQ